MSDDGADLHRHRILYPAFTERSGPWPFMPTL
jgi:hypothetical protein